MASLPPPSTAAISSNSGPMLDRAIVERLGWPILIEALAERTQTLAGAHAARNLGPLANPKQVSCALAEVDSIRDLHQERERLPVPNEGACAELLAWTQKGGALTGLELRSCAQWIVGLEALGSFLRSHAEQAPLLVQRCDVWERLPRGLARSILTAIDDDGGVRDEASTKLKQLRAQAYRLRAQMQNNVATLMSERGYQRYLGDGPARPSGHRLVVPVKASFRSHIPGIIHQSSSSGQTVFVEPEAVVALGNTATLVHDDVAREEERIRAELSRQIGAAAELLDLALAEAAHLDLRQAMAEMASVLGSHTPTLTPANDASGFRLPDLRHPLLLLQALQSGTMASVLGNDLSLAQDYSAGTAQSGSQAHPHDASALPQGLLISGPNGGGKTVVLSSVGLAALMLWSGMPIPTGPGARMPLVSGIFGILGDHQDLKRGLSTFAAHIERLCHAAQNAGAQSLVLIDEIASGTCPIEGSALACATLEALLDAGAHLYITTHMESVKAFGLQEPRMISARMGFTDAQGKPTYRLERGAAGTSQALSLAKNMGMPQTVLKAAQAYLGESQHLGPLLDSLRQQQDDLAQQQQALTQSQKAVQAAQAKLEAKAQRHAKELDQNWAHEVAEAQSTLKTTIARLQAAPSLQKAQQAQNTLKSLDHNLAKSKARPKPAKKQAPTQSAQAPKRPIEVGCMVRVQGLGQEGRVVALRGKNAEVQLGPLRSRQPIAKLIGLGAPKAQTSKKQRNQASYNLKRAGGESDSSSQEDGFAENPQYRCDLRGMRADEARRILEQRLDEGMVMGQAEIHIVHGHGSGALKAAVREWLKKWPCIDSHRPGGVHEGGDGVTVVRFES